MEYIVIIPALNPEPCLEKLVDRLWELENQVLIVDDGSGKEYRERFQKLEKKCIVLHHKENKGKGEAIKTALQYIRSELWEYGAIGVMDADGQHLPEDMEKLLMRAGTNPRTLVLGTRIFDQSVPWKSRMGNQITRKIFQMTTGAGISDTQTGLRAFSSELLDFLLEIPGERYEYEMNVLIYCVKKKIPIIEVPITTIYHDKGNSCSHFRKVRDSIRIYRKLFKFSSGLSSFFDFYGIFSCLGGWNIRSEYRSPSAYIAQKEAVTAPEKVRMTFEKEDGIIPEVFIDIEQIPRIFDNLLENSIKYAVRLPAEIQVRILKRNAKVVLEWRDRGPGVPEEKLPRIFDRFYRCDEARTIKGSGVGLYIVKYIMERHGGTAEAENDGGLKIRLYFTERSKDGEDIDRRR